jgi:hypothetical protein
MQNSVKKYYNNAGNYNIGNKNDTGDMFRIIEDKISDGKKYFEYAKKTGIGKYYIYALVNYKTADTLLEKIRFERLKKKNNKGIDDIKSGKYDFLVIAKNNADLYDKRFIETVEKEIKYAEEVRTQEESILHEIEIFFEKKEEIHEEEKYNLLLRSETTHTA